MVDDVANPLPARAARRQCLQRLATGLMLPRPVLGLAPASLFAFAAGFAAGKAQSQSQSESQAPSQSLPAPSSPPLLTISGKLRKPNLGTQAGFNLATLSGFPQTTLVTRTPWYTEERSFTGPLLRDLLQACSAHGDTLRLMALNDYRADMPVADTLKHDVILAHLIDGKPVAVRDKGPLFVMYPFGAKSELRSTIYYSRAVWQLRAIEVL